jgi:hypothetical protein
VPTRTYGDVAVGNTTSVEILEGSERNRLENLGIDNATYVDRTPRAGETLYYEIDVSSLVADTRFFLDNNRVDNKGAYVVDGWLLIPAEDFSSLSFQSYSRFSGVYNLTTRATLRDDSNRTNILAESAEQTITVDVLPQALCPNTSPLVVSEDNGTIAFGELYLSTSNFDTLDRTELNANNNQGVNETFLELVVQFPANNESRFYNISGPFGSIMDGDTQTIGGGTLSYAVDVDGKRIYTIRSLNFPNGSATTEGDLLGTTAALLDDAQLDIEEIFETLAFRIGPNHTDVNSDNVPGGGLVLRPTVVDVNFLVQDGVGNVSIISCDITNAIRIQAVADEPAIGVLLTDPEAEQEDGGNIPLCFFVNRSSDEFVFDDSEVLSARITFPTELGKAIATLEYDGVLPAGVTITREDENNWIVSAEVPSPGLNTAETRQALLNSVLCTDTATPDNALLQINPAEGWAGVARINVTAVSTERNREGGAAEVLVETAEASSFLNINVTASADNATINVKANAIGLEDVRRTRLPPCLLRTGTQTTHNFLATCRLSSLSRLR